MYYAVHKGVLPGVYTNWNDCKQHINGFSGAIFKKFDNIMDAKNFVKYGKKQPIINTMDTFLNIKKSISLNLNHQAINVYTDGSCYGNGSSISYGGSGGYFGENDSRNFSLPITKEHATNNVAELRAILKVLDILDEEIRLFKPIHIYTDSEYSIKCFTTYGDKLNKNCWKSNNNKPIPNIELIKKGYYNVKRSKHIKFIHIDAHTGKTDIHSLSNEYADKLARDGMLESIKNSDNLGENKFKLGKWKGVRIQEVFTKSPSYITWYYNTKPYKNEEVFLYILKRFGNT